MSGIPPDLLNTITTGDARVLAERLPDESIDLIVTDPPYPEEFLDCFKALAEMGRTLKVGGSLATLCGHYQMDVVIDYLRDAGLRYYWIGWLHSNGTMARLPGRYIMAGGKPMLWFVKEHRARNGRYVWDTVTSRASDKRFHEWGQPEVFASSYIEKLTDPGDVVLDPFTGGGTVPAVCKMLGRQYVAFELDAEVAERARERVRNTQPPLFVVQPEQLEIFP